MNNNNLFFKSLPKNIVVLIFSKLNNLKEIVYGKKYLLLHIKDIKKKDEIIYLSILKTNSMNMCYQYMCRYLCLDIKNLNKCKNFIKKFNYSSFNLNKMFVKNICENDLKLTLNIVKMDFMNKKNIITILSYIKKYFKEIIFEILKFNLIDDNNNNNDISSTIRGFKIFYLFNKIKIFKKIILNIDIVRAILKILPIEFTKLFLKNKIDLIKRIDLNSLGLICTCFFKINSSFINDLLITLYLKRKYKYFKFCSNLLPHSKFVDIIFFGDCNIIMGFYNQNKDKMLIDQIQINLLTDGFENDIFKYLLSINRIRYTFEFFNLFFTKLLSLDIHKRIINILIHLISEKNNVNHYLNIFKKLIGLYSNKHKYLIKKINKLWSTPWELKNVKQLFHYYENKNKFYKIETHNQTKKIIHNQNIDVINFLYTNGHLNMDYIDEQIIYKIKMGNYTIREIPKDIILYLQTKLKCLLTKDNVEESYILDLPSYYKMKCENKWNLDEALQHKSYNILKILLLKLKNDKKELILSINQLNYIINSTYDIKNLFITHLNCSSFTKSSSMFFQILCFSHCTNTNDKNKYKLLYYKIIQKYKNDYTPTSFHIINLLIKDRCCDILMLILEKTNDINHIINKNTLITLLNFQDVLHYVLNSKYGNTFCLNLDCFKILIKSIGVIKIGLFNKLLYKLDKKKLSMLDFKNIKEQMYIKRHYLQTYKVKNISFYLEIFIYFGSDSHKLINIEFFQSLLDEKNKLEYVDLIQALINLYCQIIGYPTRKLFQHFVL